MEKKMENEKDTAVEGLRFRDRTRTTVEGLRLSDSTPITENQVEKTRNFKWELGQNAVVSGIYVGSWVLVIRSLIGNPPRSGGFIVWTPPFLNVWSLLFTF